MNLALLFCLGAALNTTNQEKPINLDPLCQQAFKNAQLQFPAEKLQKSDIGIAVFDGKTGLSGQFEGGAEMYPASVVKIFWLAFLAHQVEMGKIKMTPEIARAARDMIVDSSNDATGSIVNLTTGALPGPELSGKALEKWLDQRQACNKWFKDLGYTGVNACQRTYNEGPYGREKQGVGPNGELRNRLSPVACVKIMKDIFDARICNRTQSDWMMGLLKRENPADFPKTEDSQASDFTGAIIPSGYELYSKAGWTSTTRHDLAAIRKPGQPPIIVCVFTLKPNNSKVLQSMAKTLVDAFVVR